MSKIKAVFDTHSKHSHRLKLFSKIQQIISPGWIAVTRRMNPISHCLISWRGDNLHILCLGGSCNRSRKLKKELPIPGAVSPKSIWIYLPKDALRVGRTIEINDLHPRHRRGSYVTTNVPNNFVVQIAGAVLRLNNCKLNTCTAKNITVK